MKDIDENMEDIIQDKKEFYSADINKSQISSKLNDGKQAYLYSKEDTDRIENINQSLMKITPMLPPAENQSIMGSDMKSNYN